MSRPFAVFDIDGTILRWQLYHAVSDAMARRGLIDKAEFQRVRDARMNWKKRDSTDSFVEYEAVLIEVFDGALPGLAVADFEAATAEALEEYSEQVYTFTRNLIQYLQRRNYLLFAISGSPESIVRQFADRYGFDDYAGSLYAVENGRFTGAKDLSLSRKGELLKHLIVKHGAGLGSSIGIGDSESDIDMLKLVDRPIAFNPTRKLFANASRAGWQVVLERKNMIYTLEPQKDGGYALAQTNAR